MSSSTTGSSKKQNYIKYKNRKCHCGERCAVKISESEKNPGRLYYRCELEVNQGGCHVWDWCNPINQLQVPTSTYAPNDNVDAISVVELVPPVQEVERKATNMNLITVVSFIFSGIALVMAMAAIMKAIQRRSFHQDARPWVQNERPGNENARGGVDNAMADRMQVLEGQLGTVKMMMAMCLITMVLCFFVVLLQ
ncbi:hypothetical protein RHGRI_013587 [Rhododendron griersonianum]|uniref:GRF-type domain-containing protein n=1 Tax=Rhododendron griersonianum TaxID=479676 RepID=A0AAV6K6K1_9ERIC|nr:hypothetical protein RHGRI_013587 [Rhododendron griersonianum]